MCPKQRSGTANSKGDCWLQRRRCWCVSVLHCARFQVRYWKNTETLFRHALEVTTDNWTAHYNLGIASWEAGRLQEAISHYEQALRIMPDYAEAHNNLGLALWRAGKLAGGDRAFRAGAADQARFRTGTQQSGVGFVAGRQVAGGDRALRAGAADQARLRRGALQLGVALAQLGRIQEAITHWEQALRIKPDLTEAQNMLAWLLATLAPAEGGDAVRAVTLAERACELTGNRVPTYLDTLAAAYAAAGRFNEAIATAQKAIELARAAGQTELVTEVEARLELYRAGRPYRQLRTPVRSQSVVVASPQNP